jgi:16S rRNA (guanine(966)-N(2))-methyltransferase RsmD
VRVISGSARGRRLLAPQDLRVRPTADRVKEALFSIIISREGSLAGKRVLDLCAGTGSLGIEALSRGAAEAVFVDNHRESGEIISRNIELAGFAGKGRVLVREVLSALRDLEKSAERFDLVLLDPPYRAGLAEKILAELAVSRLLTDGTLVVAEFASGEQLAPAFGILQECDRRKYGDTSVALFKTVPESSCPDPSPSIPDLLTRLPTDTWTSLTGGSGFSTGSSSPLPETP